MLNSIFVIKGIIDPDDNYQVTLKLYWVLKGKVWETLQIHFAPFFTKGSGMTPYNVFSDQDAPGKHSMHLTHSHSEQPKQAWQCWKYFSYKSIFWKENWRRNVYQNPNNNSPPNILLTFTSFQSYYQKYESSRLLSRGTLECKWVKTAFNVQCFTLHCWDSEIWRDTNNLSIYQSWNQGTHS